MTHVPGSLCALCGPGVENAVMHLAYIPFLTPLNLVLEWWYLLLIPLSFGISVIYKALRVVEFETFWREVIVMTVQIIGAMIALALALVFLVVWLIPRLPVA